MKIATSTGDFARFLVSDEDRLRALHKAGFRYVDLELYNMDRMTTIYAEGNWQKEVEKLKKLKDELCLTFVQSHAPSGNGTDPIIINEKHEEFFEATVRSIKISAALGIKNVAFHGGMKRDIGKAEWFEQNKVFIDRLIPILEEYDVNLLVENTTKKNLWGIYYPCSGQEILEFINYVNHKNVLACWDTGHANCEGSQYDDIVTLGDKLKAIHYNDNHGNLDEHVIPYLGTLNHDEVINALIDIGYSGYFTLESGNSLVRKKGWPHSRREFEKDDRLATPPLFLQEGLESLMYQTAKYMLEKYGIFEE
ncbi:MAG: sugar phosphate isomerase/epimerase [Clostridia bacterium]|nr:sugar phosphate isomerase/epimerase [Clostridia bacterium]